MNWPVVIADWSVPMWVSWVGLVIAGGLAFFGLKAATAGAKGLIADSRLSSVGFFQKLGFRLPGAVFLIKDIQLDE
jgi:hypothetical protein